MKSVARFKNAEKRPLQKWIFCGSISTKDTFSAFSYSEQA
jgi:hypothetical protein